MGLVRSVTGHKVLASDTYFFLDLRWLTDFIEANGFLHGAWLAGWFRRRHDGNTRQHGKYARDQHQMRDQ